MNGDPARPARGREQFRAAVREVLMRHARLSRTGAPMVCPPGPDGEVIFDDEQAAKDAANELLRLAGPPARSVRPCERSMHGHYHLAAPN